MRNIEGNVEKKNNQGTININTYFLFVQHVQLYIFIYIILYIFSLQYLHYNTFILNDYFITIGILRKILSFEALLQDMRHFIDESRITDYVSDDGLTFIFSYFFAEKKWKKNKWQRTCNREKRGIRSIKIAKV